MDFNQTLKKMNENFVVHILSAFREWCDEQPNEYVKDPKSLEKFLKAMKIEITDTMKITEELRKE